MLTNVYEYCSNLDYVGLFLHTQEFSSAHFPFIPMRIFLFSYRLLNDDLSKLHRTKLDSPAGGRNEGEKFGRQNPTGSCDQGN